MCIDCFKSLQKTNAYFSTQSKNFVCFINYEYVKMTSIISSYVDELQEK